MDNCLKQNVNIVLGSVEFVESSIPVAYFDIDETNTTIKDMNSDKTKKCTGDMTIQIPDGYKGE